MRKRFAISGFGPPLARPLQAAGWFAIAGIAMPTALFLSTPTVVEPSPPATASGAPLHDGVQHLPMPEEVRGVYMTSHTAGAKPLRDRIVAYAERNRLNAVVVDVKDGSGLLSFVPKRESLKAHAPEKATIEDLDGLLEELREAGLYRIARVFVFQDPMYVQRFPREAVQRAGGGVWRDDKGVSWVDPASKAAWRYNVEVAREAYERGFDEVQFDYVRFPSDGNLETVRYAHHDGRRPKHEVIRDFFAHMHRELTVRDGLPISFDLFGYVTWYVDYDLGIGQLLADALPYAAAVSPMTYPSHYGAGAAGFANPAEHPYEIIAVSLEKANALYARRDKECAEVAAGTRSATSELILPCDRPLAHQRPWIQAFDIGAVYDAAKLRAQVDAVRDKGGKGWLLWNARNVYRDFDAGPEVR